MYRLVYANDLDSNSGITVLVHENDVGKWIEILMIAEEGQAEITLSIEGAEHIIKELQNAIKAMKEAK